jgi:hypothetical protein
MLTAEKTFCCSSVRLNREAPRKKEAAIKAVLRVRAWQGREKRANPFVAADRRAEVC